MQNDGPLPFRVATLIKNSSGVQLTYRGAGVLPMLKYRKKKAEQPNVSLNPQDDQNNLTPEDQQQRPLNKTRSEWIIKPLNQGLIKREQK